MKFGTYICRKKHVAGNLGEVPQCRVIEYLWLEVDRKNAFDHGVRGVNPAVTPSELHEIAEAEDRAFLSIFCFADGSVEVVVEGIDETLSSCGARRRQSCSEPVRSTPPLRQ